MGRIYEKRCALCFEKFTFKSYSRTPDYCDSCRIVVNKLSHKFRNKKWYAKKKNLANRVAQKMLETDERVGEKKRV